MTICDFSAEVGPEARGRLSVLKGTILLMNKSWQGQRSECGTCSLQMACPLGLTGSSHLNPVFGKVRECPGVMRIQQAPDPMLGEPQN